MDKLQGRWRCIFSGQVQHVGFRYTALYIARKLSLTGWVRNLPDGRVLLEAQGNVGDLRKMLMRLKSQPHIHITHTDIGVIPVDPEEQSFRVDAQ